MHKETIINTLSLLFVLLAIVISLLLSNHYFFGAEPVEKVDYTAKIFDTSYVHQIELEIPTWDTFVVECQDEHYISCNAVIDGERFNNVALRAKGSSSLDTVIYLGSPRYSFKIEFDHFDNMSYYGLDKLNLNNVLQDNTFEKDYMVYTMMRDMGVNAPLCSYGFIRINGKDFGLYLLVEAIEESFALRNYGRDYGAIYKPEPSHHTKGKESGKMDMVELMEAQIDKFIADKEHDYIDRIIRLLERLDKVELMDKHKDVAFIYNGDNLSKYPNLFSPGQDILRSSRADKKRFIQSLKVLNQAVKDGSDLDAVLDVNKVIGYFIVHNFSDNADGYTGLGWHNYYIHEQSGRLDMIPWDYNSAFGGYYYNTEEFLVNDPIDNPIKTRANGQRPMFDWMILNPKYKQLYYSMIQDFANRIPKYKAEILRVKSLISEYVRIDPTRFCSYEDFENSFYHFNLYFDLRSESMLKQSLGEIPATFIEQLRHTELLINPKDLELLRLGYFNVHELSHFIYGWNDDNQWEEVDWTKKPERILNDDGDEHNINWAHIFDVDVKSRPVELRDMVSISVYMTAILLFILLYKVFIRRC